MTNQTYGKNRLKTKPNRDLGGTKEYNGQVWGEFVKAVGCSEGGGVEGNIFLSFVWGFTVVLIRPTFVLLGLV